MLIANKVGERALLFADAPGGSFNIGDRVRVKSPYGDFTGTIVGGGGDAFLVENSHRKSDEKDLTVERPRDMTKMDSVSTFARYSNGAEIQVGDKVTDQSEPLLRGVVLNIDGKRVTVQWSGQGPHDYVDQFNSLVKMDSMSTFANFKVGDYVGKIGTYQQGHVVGEPTESNVQFVSDRSGKVVSLHPQEVERRSPGSSPSMDAVDPVAMSRSARCPYCSKTVEMSRSTFADHRVPGGMCDGSGRVVARLEEGMAVLSSMALLTSKDFKPGDRVRTYEGRLGTVVEITNTNDVLIHCDDGHDEVSRPSYLNKA